MTPDLFPPLLSALRSNMPPGTLESFLAYAAGEVIGEREPWACDTYPLDRLPEDDEQDPDNAPGWDPDTYSSDAWDEPFAPGELPDELPPWPPPPLPPERLPDNDDGFYGAPEISVDSETPAVAAWCRAVGLNASVVGQWVWCDPHQQLGHDRAALDLVLRAAGFSLSRRRQSYYHTCTVNSARQPGDKRRGGKLERFHGTCAVGDYVAGKDMRPGWQLAKAAKAKARRKR